MKGEEEETEAHRKERERKREKTEWQQKVEAEKTSADQLRTGTSATDVGSFAVCKSVYVLGKSLFARVLFLYSYTYIETFCTFPHIVT